MTTKSSTLSRTLSQLSSPSLPGDVDFIGSVQDEWQMFSNRATDYTVGSPIGYGASSIVYSATYNPQPKASPPLPCALKVINLDALPQAALPLLTRETQLMSLSKHPHVLRVRGSWMDGHHLYIAMRLMQKGSLSDVMKYKYADGLNEEIIKCVLKQALEGLEYLHINGFIHRDIKAANLLIDDDGTVLLGDLGVAASLSEEHEPGHHISSSHSSDRRSALYFSETGAARVSPNKPPREKSLQRGKRRSFVGTPCWMAPEVVAQRSYDAKADIWSIGITALELALGRPPGAREAPAKVLMKTLRDAPPTLDRKGGIHSYSQAFKDVVDSCLAKDPALRPTAAQLLQTGFFKGAKRKSSLVGTLLVGLPPLVERQERIRRLHSPNTTITRTSWDFSHTLTHSSHHSQSPTLAHTNHPVKHSSLSLATDSVFEMDDLGPFDSSAGGGSSPPTSSQDSTSVSNTSDSEASDFVSTSTVDLAVAPHLSSAPAASILESHHQQAILASSRNRDRPNSQVSVSLGSGSIGGQAGVGTNRASKMWRKLSGKEMGDKSSMRELGGKIGGMLSRTTSRGLGGIK